ncbi:tripartite tricarboxylate transporter TctB family protein [Nisaea sediminum]|uniref:tripartite tricarboxylate transporter TctB family protein n=1 Tax=Nisaea sediminum TaxID=2775867 RepID=UPI001866D061|nr:tripartite tricarboxylate transporter TctB family protein [Nisaea sediminum]
MRRANVLSGVVLAVFGLVMLVVVIPAQIGPGPEGMMAPSLVPSMMMILVIVLSLLLTFNNMKAKPENADDELPVPISRGEFAALLKLGAVFAAAIALYLWVSPLVAGAALIVGALLALGERRPLVIVAMPTALLLAIWFLFYKVLGTGIV